MLAILKTSSIHNLEQIKLVLDKTSAVQYKAPLSILFKSSIGMHMRHIVEFYQCLMTAHMTGRVNYDARERNKRIESDLDYCKQTIDNIIVDLNNIDENKDLALHGSQELGDTICVIPTNIFRELSYLIEHTIHHMAMIKMAYDHNFEDVEIHPHFGVAYSTIKYQESVHSNVSATK